MSVRMNPGVKALWVAALQSGSFTQVTGTLCKVNSDDGSKAHCCLGVLTDLAVAAGVGNIAVEVDAFNETTYKVYVNGGLSEVQSTVTPKTVAEWAGMVDEAGQIETNPTIQGPDGLVRSLSEWNDGFTDSGYDEDGKFVSKEYKLDFDQIAGLIQRNL